MGWKLEQQWVSSARELPVHRKGKGEGKCTNLGETWVPDRKWIHTDLLWAPRWPCGASPNCCRQKREPRCTYWQVQLDPRSSAP